MDKLIGCVIRDSGVRVGIVFKVTSEYAIPKDRECWCYSWGDLERNGSSGSFLGVKRDRLKLVLPKEFVSNENS